jgi:outer membrane protein assembly factor BamB
MKLFYVLIILILFQNCSFDNKSGIWKSEDRNNVTENDVFKEFNTLSTLSDSFNETIPFNNKLAFKLSAPINNIKWNDIFYDQSNNFKNFIYSDSNEIIFKSKKITKYQVNNFILFEKDNLISSDLKGNVIIFSIKENKVIAKFNFYKKRYKKIIKKLNFIIEDNIIYISDNIGYLYAFDYKNNKILWAKNYKVPFRSNLKILENNLVAANQNNNLYFFNKLNGNKLRSIPTEETLVKNKFINNLSSNKDSLFFLNTYGSLYAINIKSMRMSWFINLNQSQNLNPSNLFSGNKIINNDSKIIVSSNQFTYVIDANSGTIIYKKKFSSQVKPIIINDYLFLISKNNLLISMNLKTGNIIYSYDINQKIAKYLNIKKNKVEFKNIIIANDKILIFLKNSYILKFNINGNLEQVKKLPSKLNTNPIIIDGSILYLDFKNKLSIVD